MRWDAGGLLPGPANGAIVNTRCPDRGRGKIIYNRRNADKNKGWQ